MPRRNNGEGSIGWVASAQLFRGQIRLQLASGEYKRFQRYAKTRKAVVQILRDLRKQAEGAGIVPSARVTVGEYLTDHWLKNLKIRPKTRLSYESQVRVHLIPGIGAIRLSRLSKKHVQVLLDSKESTLSPRSVQLIRDVLRAALNVAKGDSLVASNVAEQVKLRPVTSEAVNPYTPAEARSFLEAIKGHRLEALLTIAITCGLRQAECIGLRWQDIDWDAQRLYVRSTMQQVGGEWITGEPKSQTSKRWVPVPGLTLRALTAQRRIQLEDQLKAGALWDNEHGLVFTTQSGHPIGARNLTRDFHKIIAKAGLRTQNFHLLRHDAASLLQDSGADLIHIKELLGHSDMRLTAKTYLHLFDDARVEAMDRMDALLEAQ